MPLNKQKVSVPFSQGVNTKIDPNQKPIGTLEVLENAVFDEPGRLKKRKGYDLISAKTIEDTEITTAKRIRAFQDELCLFDNTSMYSFSESTQLWDAKGTVPNIFPSSDPVIRNTYEQSNLDSAHVLGVDVYAWEDGRGGIRASIIDTSTKNELLSDTEITSSGELPRVEAIGTKIFILYIDSTSIKYKTINPAKPKTISSETTLVSSDVDSTDKLFDTATANNKIYISWHSSTNTLKTRSLESDGTASSISEDSSDTPDACISISVDSAGRILIAYSDGSDIKVVIKSPNLTANILAPTSIETISDIVNCTIVENSSGDYNVYYEQSSSNTYDHLIKVNDVDLAGNTGTASVFLRSCGLLSKAIIRDDIIYTAVIHNSSLQSTIFIVNEDAEVISKISPGLAGDLIDSGILTKLSTIDSDSYLLTSQIKGRNVSEGSSFFSLLGVNSTVLNFNPDVKYDSASLGDILHISGGSIKSYDGSVITEHGFHLFPENLSAGTNASSGGSMSDGTFQYSAVYAWTDNTGKEHRSAPSIPLDVTTSAGGTSQTQEITIPTLRVTQKENVIIELYRTEDAGTTFYKVTSTTSPTYNNKGANSITFTDTLSDSQLISREVLYTTGGVLDNIAPPSASITETFGSRVFLAGLEEGNQIQYSKLRTEGRPVEFNDTLVTNVSSRGGSITALAAMDDKLIIFKETAIFYISGSGPNNLGEQNDFISPELITTDVGCIDQNSITLMPQGLMFKSKKGIYLLSRGLQTTYIGAQVEDFNNLTVKSASSLEDQNVVIFITDENALVYNYLIQRWSVYSNHSGLSSTILNQQFYYVRSNGEIFKQANHYTDAGSYIKLKLETSWISFTGVQGYQRVYRCLLLGEYLGPHKVLVKVAYDFKDAFIQQKIINTADFTDDTAFGENSPFGSGSPFGGSGNLYQMRINMKKQKCQSIKISIEDTQDSQYNEGLQLSNILFIVGSKNTEFKPGQSRIYGTD